MKKPRRELDRRLKDLNRAIPEQEAVIAAARQMLSRMKNERESIVSQLASDVADKPAVSDHALIRYMERRYGHDFEQYRGEILTQTTLLAMRSGAHSVKANGVELVIRGNVVVTIK